MRFHQGSLLRLVGALFICFLLNVVRLAGADQDIPVTYGTIIARIVGPNVPTAETTLPTKPGSATNYYFLVSLKVIDVRDNFAKELKGKTIKLPTSPFSESLLGQTVPLNLSYSPGRYSGSDYWLICTSIDIARFLKPR